MSLLLVTSVATVSCSKKETVDPIVASPTNADLKTFSGEQLFRGIFLLDGAVAAKLPTLQGPRLIIDKENSRNPSYVQFRAARNQEIAALVRKLDSNYFAELKQAVDSQQFDQIETAIRKGSLLLKAACLNNNANAAQIANARAAIRSVDFSKFNFSKEEDVNRFVSVMETKKKEFVDGKLGKTEGGGSTSSLYVGNSITFAVDIAVAIEVVVAVALVWVVGAQQEPGQNASSLEHETLIKDIAFNLSPANQ